MMFKYKMILSYDGTHYAGWQTQPNAPTIQMQIEKALQCLFKDKIQVVGSGRTDAGVHAFHQVAHFSLPTSADPFFIQKALNGLLPLDIRIKRVEPVDSHFHARFHAKEKHYQYFLHWGPYSDPFTRPYRMLMRYPLDQKAMEETAKALLGTRDFSAFSNEVGPTSKRPNPKKTLHAIDLVEIPGGLRIDFKGNGFLYKMVRNLVGVLLACGRGTLSKSEVLEILESKDRKNAPAPAPACGLFLANVLYETE